MSIGFSEWRKCVICGKKYIAHSSNGMYCSRACKQRASYRKKKGSAIPVNNEPKVLPPKPKTIAEVVKEARERGMSYGEYVGKVLHEQ